MVYIINKPHRWCGFFFGLLTRKHGVQSIGSEKKACNCFTAECWAIVSKYSNCFQPVSGPTRPNPLFVANKLSGVKKNTPWKAASSGWSVRKLAGQSQTMASGGFGNREKIGKSCYLPNEYIGKKQKTLVPNYYTNPGVCINIQTTSIYPTPRHIAEITDHK